MSRTSSRLVGLLLLHFLQLLNSVGVSDALFIRSHVLSNAVCNNVTAVDCFATIFEGMPEVCADQDLVFRCQHYKFLDGCFAERVGQCDAASVGRFARAAYRRAQHSCETRSHNQRSVTRKRLRSNPPSRASELQLVSALGYLQTQCAISQADNCTAQPTEAAMQHCEHAMRTRAEPWKPDFDRHMLLRIRLDSSVKLLGYHETDKEKECLIVRSTLSDLYELHHKYCFHAIVTRCLCEQLSLGSVCGIDCAALEPRGPQDAVLTWEEFTGKLMDPKRNSARDSLRTTILPFFLLALMIFSFMNSNLSISL